MVLVFKLECLEDRVLPQMKTALKQTSVYLKTFMLSLGTRSCVKMLEYAHRYKHDRRFGCSDVIIKLIIGRLKTLTVKISYFPNIWISFSTGVIVLN